MSVALQPQTAETRVLPLRCRADLDCREQQIGGSRYWHVKDPVTLRYFQLKPEEHAVLKMLDGTVSLQQIRQRFEEQFAPQRLSVAQLQSFLVMLHGNGLIQSDAPGQADVLLERGLSEKRRKLFAGFSNLLAIRFRGFDPTRLLDFLEPRCRVLFTPSCVTLCVGLMLAALCLAGLQFETLASRLPRFQEFFALENLVWLVVILGATKVLHELGHAVACRHFGGECHEMGLMLLVFTPCLYCNVSDAWMLPGRWQRIAISLAGMYVELLLASACLFLWWFSVPGFFNALCLNIVVVCSVTTILFNGNPLLRYDGYYILSDFVEIPNLRQQATALVRNKLGHLFFEAGTVNTRLLPQTRRTFLTVWYIAAVVYRVIVVWGILWFVHALLSPFGLQPLAIALATMTVATMVLAPLVRFGMLASNPLWSRTVNWPRFWFRSSLVVAVLAALAMIPLPFSVRAPAVLQAEGATSLFVQQTGRLKSALPAGSPVKPGTIIGELEDVTLERQIVQLEGSIKLLKKQLENLEDRRGEDSEAIAALIPTTKERLAEKQDELAQRKSDVEKLTLRSPVAGTVLPPRDRQSAESEDGTQLSEWTGTPLDEENRGATIAAGTEFCQVGTEGQLEAILAVDEDTIEFVSNGQQVELLFDHHPEEILTGKVSEIAEIDLDVAPPELIESGSFPTRVGEDGIARPISTAYQVRITLDLPEASTLILRGTGRARIEAASQSTARRLLRFLRQTFRFRS